MAKLLLQRLEDTDTNSWISDWRYGTESLNNILTLPESALRGRLSDDRQILELIDGFLDIFPKYFVVILYFLHLDEIFFLQHLVV